MWWADDSDISIIRCSSVTFYILNLQFAYQMLPYMQCTSLRHVIGRRSDLWFHIEFALCISNANSISHVLVSDMWSAVDHIFDLILNLHFEYQMLPYMTCTWFRHEIGHRSDLWFDIEFALCLSNATLYAMFLVPTCDRPSIISLICTWLRHDTVRVHSSYYCSIKCYPICHVIGSDIRSAVDQIFDLALALLYLVETFET